MDSRYERFEQFEQFEQFERFEPLPLSPSEFLQKSLKEKDRVNKINTIIKSLGEHSILIDTDYFSPSKFYYDSKKDVLYEITRDAELKLVSGTMESDIRLKMNK
jgi:hypothetical protein